MQATDFDSEGNLVKLCWISHLFHHVQPPGLTTCCEDSDDPWCMSTPGTPSPPASTPVPYEMIGAIAGGGLLLLVVIVVILIIVIRKRKVSRTGV